MVILGIGTNVGDRLANLRNALKHLEQIPGLIVKQVSPIYISDALLPENAPDSWDMPYLNLALRCDTTLSPHELLAQTKQTEYQLGRRPEKVWAPRPIDIDILAWDDLVLYDDKLHVPHEGLHERPFALWPLADVAPRWVCPLPGIFHGKTAAEIAAQWGSRFTGEAPLHTQQIAQRVDTPQLAGIINITPDSFSDGGKLVAVNKAIEHAYHLVTSGAEILDIGAEATGSNAIPLDPAIEWQRLEALLPGILAESSRLVIPPKISVDTRHPFVAKKALEFGINWINDVEGLANPDMCEIIAASDCDVVIMHQLGVPVDKNRVLPLPENPVKTVYQWAEKRLVDLEKKGIRRDRIIIDVGIGYGKTAEQSLELLQHIHEFHALNIRLLIGHSRKSFFSFFTDNPPAERDVETAAACLYLPVDYLRVHNVEMCARGFKIAAAFSSM